jgi:acid phosphatase family membrane protein YuiD
MEILHNKVLITIFLAWFITQFSKPFIDYVRTRKWKWSWWVSAGGMPSTHAAMIVAGAVAIGIEMGWASPLFALSVAVCMVVLYDAAGVRRLAGENNRMLKAVMENLQQESPVKEINSELLMGHTPGEVIIGLILGILEGFGVMLILGR